MHNTQVPQNDSSSQGQHQNTNPFPGLISSADWDKLIALRNSKVRDLIVKYITICQPEQVRIFGDSSEEMAAIRALAIQQGEEQELLIAGHTVHFDSYYDQGRDKEHTRILITKEHHLGSHLNTLDRDIGLSEIHDLLRGIMKGKTMFVRFYCLGPANSPFGLLALQITDSAYVVHAEDLLYRQGYSEFKRRGSEADFFFFLHSAGELDAERKTKNIAQRRIYIDITANQVFSINNQYAGNSVGLKKLALRLAINKANHEDWLAEHMFLMGVHHPQRQQVTYFAGAFPSACGKTSTAMIPGQSILGDDIIYLKAWPDGTAHAVNIESGIFGIITDVNPDDDPLIYECLTTPRELIFSNVLIYEGKPYWQGMGCQIPTQGTNFSGTWHEGKVDADGKPIPFAHKNARYTMRLSELPNCDPHYDDPDGVPVDAIIYGGRDSDTNVPILQALDWEHGVFCGATLESETTAATLGQEGKRQFSPMANLDFIVVPLSRYFQNHLNFGDRLRRPPLVFQTNYFLRDTSGAFLTAKCDKKVWILWAAGRVQGEYAAIETPIGFLPLYDDLAALFRSALNKTYSREDYVRQFAIRVDRLLAKLERAEEFYRSERLPERLQRQFQRQRRGLFALREHFGADWIDPLSLVDLNTTSLGD